MEHYTARVGEELKRFDAELSVHGGLPRSHDVWIDTFLSPKLMTMGLFPLMDGVASLIARTAAEITRPVAIVSLGAGNCEVEVDLAHRMLDQGFNDFSVTCLELSDAMLERGRTLAAADNLLDRFTFTKVDLNAWEPLDEVDIFLANHTLHHVVNLEHLFDGVRAAMTPVSRFVVNDVIGRNGHMRWPEALAILESVWRYLPGRYKYNNQLQRQEDEFINWDCSQEGFEGIRAQDILLCLMERFGFETFLGFSNLSDVFIDRSFGHNFDMDDPDDRALILRMGRLDEELIDLGVLKPTKMIASLRTAATDPTHVWKHWTPEWCVRYPDGRSELEGLESHMRRVEPAEAELAELRQRIEITEADAAAARNRAEVAEAELAALQATKTFRYSKPARQLYGCVRRHL